MLRLSRITGDSKLEQKASGIGEAFSDIVEEQPRAFTRFLVAVDFIIGPACAVIISETPRAKDTIEIIAALDKHFLTNKVILFRVAEENTQGTA